MAKKAKFKAAWFPEGKKVLTYEYRGHEYDIHPGLYTSTLDQHIMAQRDIDHQIEMEEKHAEYIKEHPTSYENTAEYGFEVFWDSVQ